MLILIALIEFTIGTFIDLFVLAVRVISVLCRLCFWLIGLILGQLKGRHRAPSSRALDIDAGRRAGIDTKCDAS